MKVLIGTFIIALALIIFPISTMADEWEKVNQQRCQQGDTKACEGLRMISELEECSSLKQKKLIVSKEKDRITIKNMGYSKIVFDIDGVVRELVPCDRLILILP